MKTYRQFVESVEDTGYLSEMQFPNPFAGMVRDVKTAADVFQYATGIKKPPVNIPAVKDLLLKGSQVPNFSNIRFKIGTPQPTAPVAPKPTPKAGGGPIATVITALTNLQGSTPQSGPAYERAKAERESAIRAKWGDAMNQTPSRFGKAGPDVTRPKGMSNIPPAEAQPGSPSYVPPTRSVTTERPKPKPTGPITSAQAIAMGSKEGQPSKSSVSTYRDAADTKGLSVGRYRTLADHRKAVADRKAEEAKMGK